MITNKCLDQVDDVMMAVSRATPESQKGNLWLCRRYNFIFWIIIPVLLLFSGKADIPI
jgi:hypothetical protein